ncbi:hypothetical protein [Pseudoduganella sp.]|uniref:hypothetical protein n=1 Tax=Pseudoduganella sp. TaxID=1880898 RepID=UPI0035B38786
MDPNFSSRQKGVDLREKADLAVDAAGVLSLPARALVWVRGLFAAKEAEVFYRTMSAAHYQELVATGRLPATAETFISPTRAFSENYQGVLVQFKMRSGTLNALEGMGVRDASALSKSLYGEMPVVSKGWSSSNAFFKAEGSQINIGLGQGRALDTFNSNIQGFSAVRQ